MNTVLARSLTLLAFLLISSPAFAQSPYDPNSPSNPHGTGMALYDANGNYHGQLGGNPYNPNSTSNPHGQYGSPHSPDSINNPHTNFGAGYRATPQQVPNPYGVPNSPSYPNRDR